MYWWRKGAAEGKRSANIPQPQSTEEIEEGVFECSLGIKLYTPPGEECTQPAKNTSRLVCFLKMQPRVSTENRIFIQTVEMFSLYSLFRCTPQVWRGCTLYLRGYLEPWVGNESGVVAQVGGVVLHHALRLRLAEVLVRRGEAAGRQHHRGRFWEENRKRGEWNTARRGGEASGRLTDCSELLKVQAGAGLPQQVQAVVEQLGAGSRVQVLQLLHRDLRLHVHDAQDEGGVLNLRGEELASVPTSRASFGGFGLIKSLQLKHV